MNARMADVRAISRGFSLPARVLAVANVIIETSIPWHDEPLLIVSGEFQGKDYVNTIFEVLRE